MAEFDRFLNTVNYTNGQLAMAVDWLRNGAVAVRNILNVFTWAHGTVDSTGEAVPQEGFGKGSDFKVTDAGGGTVTVQKGFGIITVASDKSPGGDDFDPGYILPLVLDTPVNLTPAAPASFPRVDVVIARASTLTDVNDGRFIKTTGIANTPVDTRMRYTAIVSVIQGTDGSYTPPVITGEFVELARILHTSSGNYTLYDSRPVLEVSPTVKAPPMGQLITDFVLEPTASPNTSLVVEETAPTPTLAVWVTSGMVSIQGYTRRLAPSSYTIATADPTNPRIDRVEVTSAGVIAVVTGTPSSSPVAPAGSTGSVGLAEVNVTALATSIVNADITDIREVNKMLDGSEFRSDGSIDNTQLGSSLAWSTLPYQQSIVTAPALIVDPATGSESLTTSPPIYRGPVGSTNSTRYYADLSHIPSNAEILSVTFYYNRVDTGQGTITGYVEGLTTTSSTVFSFSANESMGSSGNHTLVISPNQKMGFSDQLRVSVILDNTTGVGTSNMRIYCIKVNYRTSTLLESISGI